MRPSPLELVVLAALAAAVAGCSDDTPVAPATATPEKQFIFQGVRVEERRDDGLAWQATAERAAGDLANADATGVKIRHFPEGASAGHVVDITAPRGKLAFDEQKAVLDDVRIVSPSDSAVVTSTVAHYDGKAEKVALDGPLALTAPGLTMTAPRGEVFLKDGHLDVEGPVVGRYDRPGPPR